MSQHGPLASSFRSLLLLVSLATMASAQGGGTPGGGGGLYKIKVTQHEITVFFNGPHEVGKYANGDWWVVGPVTIVDFTPQSRQIADPNLPGYPSMNRWVNGAELNPSPKRLTTTKNGIRALTREYGPK